MSDSKDEKEELYSSVRGEIDVIDLGSSVHSSRFHQGLGKCFTCSNAVITKTSRSVVEKFIAVPALCRTI